MDESGFLLKVIEHVWRDDMWVVLLAVIVMFLVVFRVHADSRNNLKHTLYFLAFCFIGFIGSGVIHATGNTELASSLRPILVFIAGLAVIRLGGLFVFRVIFGAIRPFGIIEELLVVMAYFLWAMFRVHVAGVAIGEIITTSAVVTAILAFAMKDTLGNILGGLSLELDRSVKVGDWVHIGEIEGKVLDIKWRAVTIETRNWETVVLPNSRMMQEEFKILGLRQGEPLQWKRWIWFNVDFSVSPNRVIHLAERAVTKASIPNVATGTRPSCILVDIDGSTAHYALRYFLTNMAEDGPTDSAVRQHLYAALNRKHIRLAMSKQHIYLTSKDDTYEQKKHDDEIKHRIATISQVDLFQSLTSAELADLAERLVYKPYAENDVLFEEGDNDHSLYIITSGVANIYVKNEDGERALAFSLHAGEYFGETGLMTGSPRAGTVIANTALECFRLHKKDFVDTLQSLHSVIDEISQVMVSRHDSLAKARHHVQADGSAAPRKHDIKKLVASIKSFLAKS